MTATSKAVVKAQGSNSLNILRWFRWGLELAGGAVGQTSCLATIASTGSEPNAFTPPKSSYMDEKVVFSHRGRVLGLVAHSRLEFWP